MMSMLGRRWAAVLAVAVLASTARGAGVATSGLAKGPGTLEAMATTEIAAAWELAGKDDFAGARAGLEKALDLFAAYGMERNGAALRETAYALRVVRQLEKVEGRGEVLAFVRKNETVGHALAFLISEQENPAPVYALLNRLREKHPKEVETYASLAAAVCVVHASPLTRHINENQVKSPEALEVFEYYIKNEGAMYFGIKPVPAELLVYVVDTTTPIEQMNWALKRYAKDDAVGRHFFDIKYDTEHFRTGAPKKVTVAGFSLPNILQYGGVCVDQAYFAMEVGKAIGVPTAYATASSGEAGHAWVGFLQSKGGQGWWNFDVGRYEEYKGIKGTVLDLQTRRGVPDCYVSLTAEMIGTKAADRQIAAAWCDAAARVIGGSAPAAAAEGKWLDGKATARPMSAEGALDLLELGLRKNVGYARGWFEVRDLAKDGKLTLEQKKRWSELVLKLCGAKYPDFAWAIIEPMILTVDEVKEQDRLWTAAFGIFQGRSDLAASVRMAQARMWEQKGEAVAAEKCYWDVVDKFANAGPFVFAALAGTEKMLRESGKTDKVTTLYEQTWGRTKKPGTMGSPFARQSNWYQVGKMYAAKLHEAGDEKKAAAVEAELEPVGVGAGKKGS